MTVVCVNTCTCSRCIAKRPLQFHVSIDPNLYPAEYRIALIAKKQKGFNKLFREFLKEYAIRVAEQVERDSVVLIKQ